MDPNATNEVLNTETPKAPVLTGTFINSKYDVPVEKRDQLSTLSQEVYGSPLRWIKFTTEGRKVLETQQITEVTPVESEDDKRTEAERTVTTRVPVAYKDSRVATYVFRRLSLEEVEAEMNNRKEQIEAFKAAIAQAKEDARKKKEQEDLEKSVGEKLNGSAL